MKIQTIIKKILISTMLLTLGSSNCVFAESQSVDPKNLEIEIEEALSSFDGELDPTTITNMQEFIPQDSQITSLNQIPNGDGSVIESESTGETKAPEGKEFYVIQTNDEQLFYLIIDHAKSSDNVYFLNQINASNLILETEENSLNTSSSSSSSSSSKEVEEEKKVETEEATTTENDVKEKSEVKEPSKKSGDIFLLIVIIVGFLGVGYYVKIYKPKKKMLDDALDFENDFEGISEADDYFEEDIEEDLEEDEAISNSKKTSRVHVETKEEPKVKSKRVSRVQEEIEEELEDEWEEPITKPKKQKKINNERQTTVNRYEQPQNTKGLNALGIITKVIFGSILICLVSLGLTVLTNESLRNMIMETVKNYF